MSFYVGVPGPSAASLQKQRQRRYHRRSRNGCTTCKKRHVRCDEARPICSNCLRSGADCGYPDPFVTVDAGQAEDSTASSSATPSEASSEVTGALVKSSTPASDLSLVESPPGTNFFTGFPIELSEQSQRLFYELAQQRFHHRPVGGGGPKEYFVVHKALENEGYLHGSLLLAAVNRIWKTKSMNDIQMPILHHKQQAYKFVAHHLANPSQDAAETVVATVGTLALLEAALWECNPDGLAATVTHLKGFQKVVSFYHGPVDESQTTVFQRTLRMTMTCISEGDLSAQPDEYANHVNYHPMPLCVLFMALWPTPKMAWWLDTVKGTVSEYYKRPGNPLDPDIKFNGLPQGERLRQWYRASRSAFIACYMYVAMMLKKGAMNSYILNWLIEQFLEDAETLESAMRAGTCNRTVYLWALIISRTAVASVECSNELEKKQAEVWEKTFDDKIRLSSSILELQDWTAVQKLIGTIAWVPGFRGEDEIKTLWEVAMFGNIDGQGVKETP